MSISPPRALGPRRTTKATDITGLESLMFLFPNPGDERGYEPFMAELCARGRPPFIVILGDGADDGSDVESVVRERASRAALRALGLPDDRVLFVGLRKGSLPVEGHPLFEALRKAMALLNWRKDCNVVGASLPRVRAGDQFAAWQVARAIALASDLPLIVGATCDAPAENGRQLFDFDGSAWLSKSKDALHTDEADLSRRNSADYGRFFLKSA